MKIFSRQAIFFCVVVCANNFFRLPLSVDNLFFTRVSNQWSRLVMMMMMMMMILIIISFYGFCCFSFLFTPRLTGYGMRPV